MAGMSQHEKSHAVKGTSSSCNRDTGNDSWQCSKNPTRNDHHCKAKACKLCCTTHAVRNCPAYGRSCNKCGMRNHFARCCSNFGKAKQTQKKMPVHTVKPYSNNHAEGNMFVYTVLNSRNREWQAVLDINGRGLKVKIDTGVSSNVISKQVYDVLNARQPKGIRARRSLNRMGDIVLLCKEKVLHS